MVIVIRLLLLILLLAVPILAIGTAHAQQDTDVLYEYANDLAGLPAGGNVSVYLDNWSAQTIYPYPSPHDVTKVRLHLVRVGITPWAVTLSIVEGNVTGNATEGNMASFTIDGDDVSTSPAWYEFDFSNDNVQLEANGTYSLVLRAEYGDNNNYIRWQQDPSSQYGPGVAAHSVDGGVSWINDSPADYIFEVWGIGALRIRTAEVYSAFLETGDMLFVTEYFNQGQPYYPDVDAKQWFEIRLLDTDGTTLIASSPCREYEDMPGSIYLSVSASSSLTIGSAYVIQLYGDFGSGSNHKYTLTSADWKGDNLVFLDTWVINTAKSMEVYNGIDYTTNTDAGEVLNNAGANRFKQGVPMLSTVRAHLFEIDIQDLDIAPGTANPAMEAEKDWEVAMGPDFVASMQETGALIGLEPKHTAATMIAILFVGIAFVAALMGSAAFGVVLAMPALAFGGWAGFVSLSAIAVIVILLAFLFAWWFWWQPT